MNRKKAAEEQVSEEMRVYRQKIINQIIMPNFMFLSSVIAIDRFNFDFETIKADE